MDQQMAKARRRTTKTDKPTRTINLSSHGRKCAAQHFGPWLVEASWFNQAIANIKDGTMVPGEPTPTPTMAQVNSGVAVIPIMGQITKGDSSFEGTSSVATRQALRAAVADDEVDSILLHIDSPGGTVSGTADLADDVRMANSVKPVHAHIDDMGASAAFWVASQAGRVTANSTALVGSIGTMLVLTDSSGLMDKAGVKVHALSTGAHKGAGVDGMPITDDQLQALQINVDDMNEHFLAGVSAGRNLDRKRLESVADGRVFIAEKAKSLGLIDSVQTLDETFKEILTMNESNIMDAISEKPELIASHIEQAKRIATLEAKAEIKTELADLLKASGGNHKMAVDAFLAGQDAQTVSAIATAVGAATAKVNAELEAAKAELAKFDTEGEGTSPIGFVPTQEGEAIKPDSFDSPKAQAQWEWDNDKALQTRLGNREAGYVRARVNELQGRVKINATSA